jgi:methionyl-tRNA formyltransferase
MDSTFMRIVFMGTPALAIPSLQALEAEHEIAMVVTQPDKIAGRGHKLTPPPVKEYSLTRGFSVEQPEKARDAAFVQTLRAVKPDAIAVVAYGQILPREILDMPRENFPNGGCVNLHFSLLPRWRGAAPVQYAIWHGDKTSGVTTQWMAEKLDAGDVILQREVPIAEGMTSGELFDVLTPLGAEVLCETMRLMQDGKAPRSPQDETQATFAPTIKKEDVWLDWSQDATQLQYQVLAFNPRPTAQCQYRGERLKVWFVRATENSTKSTPGELIETKDALRVACGEGALELLEVQPAGKPRMKALDWVRGARLQNGDMLE